MSVYIDRDQLEEFAMNCVGGLVNLKQIHEFPAVHVPPHGRLIDADEISEHKYTTIPPHRKEYADGKPKSDKEIIAFKFGWNSAIDAITDNAPTIIPAEESES